MRLQDAAADAARSSDAATRVGQRVADRRGAAAGATASRHRIRPGQVCARLPFGGSGRPVPAPRVSAQRMCGVPADERGAGSVLAVAMVVARRPGRGAARLGAALSAAARVAAADAAALAAADAAERSPGAVRGRGPVAGRRRKDPDCRARRAGTVTVTAPRVVGGGTFPSEAAPYTGQDGAPVHGTSREPSDSPVYGVPPTGGGDAERSSIGVQIRNGLFVPHGKRSRCPGPRSW